MKENSQTEIKCPKWTLNPEWALDPKGKSSGQNDHLIHSLVLRLPETLAVRPYSTLNQEIILGIYSQCDDVQFRVFHLPHRFDSIVQNISEESIYIAILHEIQPPSICHAGNVDAQTVAGEHFACQHHVQRRVLRMGFCIIDIHQFADFLQLCPVSIILCPGADCSNLMPDTRRPCPKSSRRGL